MISKSTLLHLRIPFSLFLLPFFCFAVSQSAEIDWFLLMVSFLIIHLLFYPSSNGYNSYYDKDEESIGGLKNPPPVNKELLWVSIALELSAIIFSYLISWQFSLMLVGIIIASRAYSHPAIRLKKYPFIGLLTVAFFQGAYTYFMSTIAISHIYVGESMNMKNIWAASLCSFMLLGSYPMTQIYQHNEDSRRGDKTMSRLLGINGTFWWTGLIFTTTTIGFVLYFYNYYSLNTVLFFIAFQLPISLYFLTWYLRVRENQEEANYESTMRLNLISTLSFTGFFIFLIFIK